MAMATTFEETFNVIKSKHDEAFRILDLAVRCEEEENIALAFKNYKKGVGIIDEALATPVRLPENTELVKTEWNEACKMIHKLKKARAEVVQRIGFLSRQLNLDDPIRNISPTQATIAESTETTGRPRTYSELAQALRDMHCGGHSLNSLELVFSCDGVKLYHIKSNGLVTTTMDHSTMRIVRMEKDESKSLQATFFIQIIKSSSAVPIRAVDETKNATADLISEESKTDLQSNQNNDLNNLLPCFDNFDAQNDSSWIYPLVPGVSPCFRTDYGAFIFPDLESSEPGASFGIIVPKDDRIDEIVLEILEAILHGVVIQTEEGKEEEPIDANQRVSRGIIRGAHFISRNLIKGAEKTGSFISYTTPFLISKIRAAPPDAQPVSQNVQNTVTIAKNVTGAAAGATSYIAGKVGSATMALGRFLAPHIQKHGSTLLSKGLGLDEHEAQEKMNGILTIAAGAVEGFGTVYSGLEESAKILGRNLGENSVKIIEHKYGPSAGNLAAGTFDTVGNMINFSQNINYLTAKGLAKRTVKNASKAIVENYRPNNPTMERRVPASSLYPDLSLLQAEIKK